MCDMAGMEAVHREVELELKQHGRLLSPADMEEDGKGGHSWRPHILPPPAPKLGEEQ